jgi:tRNA (guanine10-N2)-dimethyltransferase
LAKLFFLLSGENETLPASELTAILEAEGYTFEFVEKLDQVVRLEADQNSVNAVQRRSAYTRICALELFTCEAQESAIVKMAESTNFQKVLKEGESFAVRVKRVKTYAEKIGTVALEGKLGKHILQNTVKTKVNLKTPDKTFIGILTNEKLVFGIKLAEIAPKPFVERRPRKKPFFHPSAMPSKLARCMVNIAHAKTGELVLDPFCGTGSVIIEAALIGCHVLGLDVQRRMTKGCRKNLKHFRIEPEGVVLADARMPPLAKVDCLVTDPPYGRSATTMKLTTKRIVEEVLFAAQDMLSKGQRICMASPMTLNIARIGEELGYKHLESHFAYVHRTLTREIAVFEKV